MEHRKRAGVVPNQQRTIGSFLQGQRVPIERPFVIPLFVIGQRETPQEPVTLRVASQFCSDQLPCKNPIISLDGNLNSVRWLFHSKQAYRCTADHSELPSGFHFWFVANPSLTRFCPRFGLRQGCGLSRTNGQQGALILNDSGGTGSICIRADCFCR